MQPTTDSWDQPIKYDAAGKSEKELRDDLSEYTERINLFDILIDRINRRRTHLASVRYQITAALSTYRTPAECVEQWIDNMS